MGDKKGINLIQSFFCVKVLILVLGRGGVVPRQSHKLQAPVQFGAARQIMWFVYIIKCEDGSLYTGATNDLEKRFQAHKSGKGGRYTRSHIPEKIVFFEKHSKKIVALRREREIKNLTRKEKIKIISNKNMSG